MFRWIKNLFGSNGHEAYDVYKPAKRLIYSYWNGINQVQSDPMNLYKRMMDKGVELSIDVKLANSQSKDNKKGHDSLVNNVREIFRIKSFEEGGLTELEALNLLDHFLGYCEWLKKNSSRSPTLSNNSVDSTSSSEESPIISNSSASGSAENESFTEKPVPLPTALESPSEQSVPV